MIAFLILHYKNVNETLQCVKSIESMDFSMEKALIYIVDNGSNDESSKILQQRFKDSNHVVLIFLQKNIGFSAGNNAGFAEIKKQKNIEYAIVCNSDIVFTQSDFIQKVQEIYQKRSFDVLGPDIYKVEKRKRISTSPMYSRVASLETLVNTIKISQCRLQAIERGETSWLNIKTAFPSLGEGMRYGAFCIGKKMHELINSRFPQKQENVLLQGACLIFSSRYINRHEKLFYPETFLYYEEVILLVRAQRENLQLVYDPTVKVWHKEGRSTNADEEKISRYEKHLKNRLEALQICRDYLSENDAKNI